ncbi:hypothetical protein DAI22_04g046901 [Oryza sativa Japonica Group]|uniref:BURP domain-containing protein 5 n=2 Tax=Oryza sativa subsp. japonica TaxID=39947 RepID=BURP5_ORYSJ|nr:RecName: Full=BURP domain-containing protein 5; Short=OsBURP05; Flags: Precursor [Oryza sativa Japonica Group]KAF2933023.1 hypothetical protein DAI22_04g046901 [Oryza sativa Japonica Group]
MCATLCTLLDEISILILMLLLIQLEIRVSAAQGGGSHAAMSPEQYWRSILPDSTPMPISISQLLGDGYPYSPAVGLPKRGDRVQIRYGPNIYGLAASQQFFKDPTMGLFFLETNLQSSKSIKLHFANMMAGTKFLPRGEADAVPFSSKDLQEILARFGVRPGSVDASVVKNTLLECELPANKGEKKACATSLESMVDFVASSLGTRDIKAASTFLVGKDGDTPAQEYTVTGARRMAETGQLIACHPESYPYAVFMCHLTEATRAYKASLVGKDGAAVEAVAVCHTDTAEWNPKHAAFQVLGVKPGTVPVCHFVQPDVVVWTRRG